MILSILKLLPLLLLGSFLVYFIPSNRLFLIRFIAIIVSVETFLLLIFLRFLLNESTDRFQFYQIFFWSYRDIFLGIDSISLFLIILTTFLIPLCILTNWNNYPYFKEYEHTLLKLIWMLRYLPILNYLAS